MLREAGADADLRARIVADEGNGPRSSATPTRPRSRTSASTSTRSAAGRGVVRRGRAAAAGRRAARLSGAAWEYVGGSFSPRAKKVLELSLREALRLKHNYIGTEHILLGLIREGEGLGALVLTEPASASTTCASGDRGDAGGRVRSPRG